MFSLKDFKIHFVIPNKTIKWVFKSCWLVFSIKKCPTHAKPYPDNNAYKINKKLKDKKNCIKKNIPILVPIKWVSLVYLLSCSDNNKGKNL